MTGTPPEMLMDSDGHPNVVAWRLGKVEEGVEKLSAKLDLVVQNYPTTQTLSILLDPMKGDIKEIQDKLKDTDAAKSNAAAQLKLAIVVAILSPLFSFVITLIMVGAVKP